MSRLPRLRGKELVRILERLGFESVRTRGSHVFLKHPDGRVTTVPVHSGKLLALAFSDLFSATSKCQWKNSSIGSEYINAFERLR